MDIYKGEQYDEFAPKFLNNIYEIVKNFCEITNTDTKSTIACFYYLEFLLGIKNGKNKVDIFVELQDETKKFIRRIDKNVLENPIPDLLYIKY